MKRTYFTLLFCISALAWASAQFKLPSLTYRYSALEPYIDSTTMYIHLNNHHAAYVNNLNKTLEKYPDLQQLSIEELLANLNKVPTDIQTAIKNNGGGHYNHSLFWTLLAPVSSSKISPALEQKLSKSFGSLDAFKVEFEKAALSRFGSGWVWLIKNNTGDLQIISTPNQESPIMSSADVKGIPVLLLDVWEHAYYLKYQSKRAAYVKAFWNVVNWQEVEKRVDQK